MFLKILRFTFHIFPILAGILLAAVLGRAIYLWATYSWKVATFPYPVDYGEGPILDQVMRMSRMETIYRPLSTQPPFTITNYPPVYHILQLPFAWLFGPAYWYGRGISLLSTVMAGIFIALTLQVLTQDWIASILGGLTLFSIPYVLHWSPFCRVDCLALGLSLAGIYTIVRHPHSKRGLVISGVLLTAAIFTRQSYGFAAPFAAFIWLVSQKPRLQAIRLVFWVGGLSIVLFLLANLFTHGSFYFNIITANVNPFIWQTVKNYAKKTWEHMPYFVLSSSIFLLLAGWFRVKSWRLAAPYLFASTLSAITIGKDGSNVNYLLELSAALSLTAGAILALSRKRWWARTLLFLLLAGQVFYLYDWTREDYYNWVIRRVENERDQIAQMLNIVKETDRPVLADEYMGLIPLAGRELTYQPFEFKQLAIANIWDETPFLESLRQKEYGAILLFDPPTWDSQRARWTQSQLITIIMNYQRAGRYANTILYKPIPLDR